MTQIDNNYYGVAKAVTDDANKEPKPLLVDPVTGRLLIAIMKESYTGTDVSSKIDENYEGVALVITDDTNKTIKPLKVHPTSGRLLADLIVE